MKILLVNPETPDTFWSLKNALRFISKKAILPPLGLLTVAAILPGEWEKRLVDMAVSKLHDRHIIWADYVFLTGMFIQRESARQIIERCKKLGKAVVAGGPLFTAVPEMFDDVDHLVLNEAEITLPLFLKDLESGTARHIYESRNKPAMKDSPAPLWELSMMNKYAVMCIQYSRGCPFHCDFCDVTTLFGRRIRTKTKEQMSEELERLYRIGWRGDVFIVDDNFIGNKVKLKKEILPAIIRWMRENKYPFTFNTQVSINLADDDELMGLMAEAGFDCVFIGIETPNEESLAECNKHQNTGRDMVECVRKIQRFGMQVQAGFILGFDSDQPPIFDSLIGFIQQSGIATAMVGLLNAPRGSKLYDRLTKERRLLEDSSGNNTDFSINFIPKMGYEQLVGGYRKVVGTIYSHEYFYERSLTFLKNFRPLHRARKGVRPGDIMAFVRSVWHMGVKCKGRIHYWRLISWALGRPWTFPLAVRLSIYGYHFRKVFDSWHR